MRIFVDPELLAQGELTVLGDDHHYLTRVRRARIGDPVDLVDGAGQHATARIVRISDDHTVLDVSAPAPIAARPPFVRVLVPLIKGDRMETCLEKLVEVGADSIVVWPAERSVVRLDPDRRAIRLAKYRQAIQAAARQCGRAQLPDVSWANDLGSAIDSLPGGLKLVLDPTSDDDLTPGTEAEVTVVSGPEGGLTPAELIKLSAFRPVGMGPRVLRAETAPVVAVAVIRTLTRS